MPSICTAASVPFGEGAVTTLALSIVLSSETVTWVAFWEWGETPDDNNELN